MVSDSSHIVNTNTKEIGMAKRKVAKKAAKRKTAKRKTARKKATRRGKSAKRRKSSYSWF